jgi:hypothetical protein
MATKEHKKSSSDNGGSIAPIGAQMIQAGDSNPFVFFVAKNVQPNESHFTPNCI